MANKIDNISVHEISYDLKRTVMDFFQASPMEVSELKETGSYALLDANGEVVRKLPLRKAFQIIGNDVLKNVLGKKVWCNLCYTRAFTNPNEVIVITGIRLLEEINFFLHTAPQDYDVIVVKVERTGWEDPQPSNHVTEMEVDLIDEDVLIQAKDMDELTIKADEFIPYLMDKVREEKQVW